MTSSMAGRPRKRIFAAWAPRQAHGTRLAGGRYLVHVDFDVVEGPADFLGREVEVELTPAEACRLADALTRYAAIADEYEAERVGRSR